ncbi:MULTISPECIES: hypothetical protein [unclassified Streptomyces]|uniref:hypothetical protein n=1 Tax=unclassified Streptomyces TaxID=2593676 RepID=UPI00202E7EE4|nr:MULTISPECIES: hypothetical protein [unclassified Streptomyces]MCM1965450.1 hypothetical protein [Streptomyces sp. G1]MCX5124117.1 hypothetical protein [Streptomyces sp. NBC_00347]MCX5297362.1 hypothetical protein [Streptomyces sp. NBC_00193]
MAANHDSNHNSQAPEGDYDPAGSTQMFRAFVDEPVPAPAVPGSRMQNRAARKSGPGAGLWIGVGVAALVLIAVVAWLAL